MSDYTLNINGAQHRVSAPADETLLSVLRNRLRANPGTKNTVVAKAADA